MRKKERYEKILAWFRENVPVAETELHYDNPFELLIAVILSAQCTDKRVNMITPALYRDFPTPEALAATTPDVVYEYIRSVSYPNNKAKHLVGNARPAPHAPQRRIYRLKHCAYENNFVYFGAKNRIDRVSERGTQTVRKRIKHYRSIHCREYYCRKEKPGHFSDQTAGLSKKAKIKRI